MYFLKESNFMWALLVSLIIPFLIWGPFVPDLIVSLSSLFFWDMFLKNGYFFILLKNH